MMKATFRAKKVGPNRLCPCGSGKKYKKCCGVTSEDKKATGGRLAETLERILEPRIPPGKPGRPKGAPNYEWTPEMDRLLAEFAERFDLAKAKYVIAQRLLELCPRELMPRQDSLRNVVERRMAFLGLATGNPRKKAEPNLAAKKATKEVRSGGWT